MDMIQEPNQSQEALLCSKGCGFHGNPKTEGMCSLCYKDFLQTQIITEPDIPPAAEPEVVVDHAKKSRCFSCRKKIHLTVFDCRCGNSFCSLHRYAEDHDCTFDYKADAAKKLSKENPVVSGEKIRKI